MKNKDLETTYARLNRIEIPDVNIKYAVAKNKRLIEQEWQILEACLKPSNNFDIYNRERVELCKVHAQKDEKGKAKKFIDGYGNERYIIDENKQEAFDIALEELRVKHKEAIEERKKQEVDYEDLLEKESKLVLHKIKKEDIINCTNAQVDALFDIIEEEEDKN